MEKSEENIKKIVKVLCGEWAERYQQESRRNHGSAEFLIQNPINGLSLVLGNAFARAGGEQAGYGGIAVQALEMSIAPNKNYTTLMGLSDAPQIVWNSFVQICNEKQIGTNSKLNEGAVKGIVKLAQNSIHLNPFEHLGSNVVQDTVGTFMLLRNIKGVGDKIAPFIVRDIVTILDLEEKITPGYQILLQPVDRWIKGISSFLWNYLGDRIPSWLIALTVVTKCREYGVSPARFNQGAWMYGSSTINDTANIPQGMSELSASIEKHVGIRNGSIA